LQVINGESWQEALAPLYSKGARKRALQGLPQAGKGRQVLRQPDRMHSPLPRLYKGKLTHVHKGIRDHIFSPSLKSLESICPSGDSFFVVIFDTTDQRDKAIKMGRSLLVSSLTNWISVSVFGQKGIPYKDGWRTRNPD